MTEKAGRTAMTTLGGVSTTPLSGWPCSTRLRMSITSRWGTAAVSPATCARATPPWTTRVATSSPASRRYRMGHGSRAKGGCPLDLGRVPGPRYSIPGGIRGYPAKGPSGQTRSLELGRSDELLWIPTLTLAAAWWAWARSRARDAPPTWRPEPPSPRPGRLPWWPIRRRRTPSWPRAGPHGIRVQGAVPGPAGEGRRSATNGRVSRPASIPRRCSVNADSAGQGREGSRRIRPPPGRPSAALQGGSRRRGRRRDRG